MKEPWELYPDIWKSKATFFAYLRGGLRLMWSRYPAKLAWKKGQLFTPPKGYTGRAKKLGTCHYCKSNFPGSNLEVDHIEQAGQCNSWETASVFMQRLLDVNNNWVLACKPCHKVKSFAERNGQSFDEALLEKEVIAFMKQPKEEVVAFCIRNGYNLPALRNAEQRRKAVHSIKKLEKGIRTG